MNEEICRRGMATFRTSTDAYTRQKLAVIDRIIELVELTQQEQYALMACSLLILEHVVEIVGRRR